MSASRSSASPPGSDRPTPPRHGPSHPRRAVAVCRRPARGHGGAGADACSVRPRRDVGRSTTDRADVFRAPPSRRGHRPCARRRGAGDRPRAPVSRAPRPRARPRTGPRGGRGAARGRRATSRSTTSSVPGVAVDLLDDVAPPVGERDQLGAGVRARSRSPACAGPAGAAGCVRPGRRCPRRSAPTRRPGRRRARPAARRASASTVAWSAWSILLSTICSGTWSAPISSSTSRTATMCASASGWDASTTWTSRSAFADSSRVDLNASTRPCGSFCTNPTVSVSTTSDPSCRSSRRTVGSSVANSLSSTSTSDAGQPVQQRRLAGVGVADERGDADPVAVALGGLGLADPGEVA